MYLKLIIFFFCIAVHGSDKNRPTPLEREFNKDISSVNKLISQKPELLTAVINEFRDRSAVHYAAFIGRADILKLLKEKGVDLNKRTKYGETP